MNSLPNPALQTQTTNTTQRKCATGKMVSSMKLSVTFLLLLSGLVVFGEIEGATAACEVLCIQGGHIICENYPGQELDGCACECAPADGKGCVLHLDDGVTTTNCSAPEY